METLKYKVVKTKTQYNLYCRALENLLEKNNKLKAAQDEIDLLTLLIETWDEAHNSFYELSPIEILKSLMKDHQLKAVDLAKLLNVSESLVSDMLHYKKRLVERNHSHTFRIFQSPSGSL